MYGKRYVWTVTGQLNGLYMPDYQAVFGSRHDAEMDAKQMAEDFAWGGGTNGGTVEQELYPDRSYFFCSDKPNAKSFPYYYKVQPEEWREIAREIKVRTRKEVLEYDYQF